MRKMSLVIMVLALLAAGLQAKDYEIKVRLLNGRTGGPFPNKEVSLGLSDAPLGLTDIGVILNVQSPHQTVVLRSRFLIPCQ